MIAGYHLIWTAYGWWLPNDPRGSTSRDIRCAAIAGLGDLHYGRKKLQPAGRVLREFYEAARSVLQHALLVLSEEEIVAVGKAFAEVIRRRNYTCYGCAVMPDHVHALIRKHRDRAETMIAHYIRNNPPKARRPAQHWPFVTQYDGWLPGQVRLVRKAAPPAKS